MNNHVSEIKQPDDERGASLTTCRKNGKTIFAWLCLIYGMQRGTLDTPIMELLLIIAGWRWRR